MGRKSKRYLKLLHDSGIDFEQSYSPIEAIRIVKGLCNANFDETIEMACRLGVDPRRADQMLRGTISLPSGTGKQKKVAVFAAGEYATEARNAGADIVGADDLVERVLKENFLDFDVAIATPDMMVQVGKLGKILGPRSLMPNPKTGTVTQDIARTVAEFKSGRIEYRTDRTGIVHLPIGKASFSERDLLENFRAVIDELTKVKPAAAKGRYFKSVVLAPTMGPGVSVDCQKLRITDEELALSA